MSYRLLFLILLIIGGICAMNYLFSLSEKHDNEMKRINMLEKKLKQKQFMVDQARLNSTPCPVPDLMTPKECYMESNYQCNWSIESDRCNLIEN